MDLRHVVERTIQLRARYSFDAGGYHVGGTLGFEVPSEKGTRAGALMRLLGCLDVGSGRWFDAVHVAGVDNYITDGISMWKEEVIDDNLHASRPDVAWCRQLLGPTGVELC